MSMFLFLSFFFLLTKFLDAIHNNNDTLDAPWSYTASSLKIPTVLRTVEDEEKV